MKNEEIILNIYRDLYLNAEPTADFDELVKNATKNEIGERVINFLDYEITQEKEDEIFKKHLVNKRITKLKQQAFRNTIILGASPKHKK